MITKKHIAIYAAVLTDPLIVSSYNPLVSLLKAEFNVDIRLIALGLTFHMMSMAILCLFSGFLSNIFGRPKIIMYGLILSSFGLLITALSPNIAIFLLSRSIQGAGDGFFMGAGLAMLGDITPTEEMGNATGFYGVAIVMGATMGPLLSGFVSSSNWRYVTSLLFAYALVVAILVRIILGSYNQEQGRKGSDGVLREFKDVLQNRIIIIVSMVAFLSYFVYSGIQPLISDLLSLQPFKVNPGELGIMFSVVSFTAIFFSLLGGFLLDRFNDRKILGLACAITLGVTCLLIFGNTYLQYFLLLPSIRLQQNRTDISSNVSC